MNKLYGGLDPRNIHNYTTGDAARYLRIPEATIRSWTIGQSYLLAKAIAILNRSLPFQIEGSAFYPLQTLSKFISLELSVKRIKFRWEKVRATLDFVEAKLKVEHPLARQEFRTDGVDLFIEHYGNLINVIAGCHQYEAREKGVLWAIALIHYKDLR